jgi:hypothetical protein
MRVLKTIIIVIATLVLTAIVAPTLAGDSESRIQRLLPQTRDYAIVLRVLGPYPMTHERPASIKLRIAKLTPDPDDPNEPFETESGPALLISIDPGNLQCRALDRETESPGDALGTFDAPLFEHLLGSIGVQRSSVPGEDALELVRIVTRLSREGYRLLEFPEDEGGGRASGMLEHFDGRGHGSLRIYGPGPGPLVGWWLGLCTAAFATMLLVRRPWRNAPAA